MAAGYTKGARMTDTNTGWRKRQIALDQKAENARELGLNYEPNKTIIEMAREAGFMAFEYPALIDKEDLKKLESFAALVREDERDKWMERAHIMILGEREACAKVCDELANDENTDEYINAADWCAVRIRARGQA